MPGNEVVENGLVPRPSPEALALASKRGELRAARWQLTEREAALDRLRSQLGAFEALYLREVGVLYAELDGLALRVAELQARTEGSGAARERVEAARRRAQESHEAAFGPAETSEEHTEPPPDLKRLFREVAKRIHPDRARDDAEAQYLHLLMARANQAYSRGQVELLQRLLDNFVELNGAAAEESVTAELLRVSRQIQQAHRELAQLEMEEQGLMASETAQLYQDAELAALAHRDLLAELAARVREQIGGAQRQLAALEGARA